MLVHTPGNRRWCWCAGQALLEWRATFTPNDPLKQLLDTSDRRWAGDQPCNYNWWGISCGYVGGVLRVTNM